MTLSPKPERSKVPELTLAFWILKVAATTLGEIGGDAVSMSMNLGYLIGSLIFGAIFLVVAVAQVRADRFRPALYWSTIVATTTVGTTVADYADRSLGVGYAGGSAILSVLLLASLVTWHRMSGTVAVASVSSPRAESFYWITIFFSQTLGTALGDWTVDTAGLGYRGGIAIFAGLLTVVILAWWATSVSRTALFWAAFVLTRPLGAVLGDFLDKPIAQGGLALSRYSASIVLAVFMVFTILLFPPRAAALVGASSGRPK
ncbi:MAG: hypothetical protein ABIV06_07365 [Thermoanaerobaculia bacterium]